MHTLGRCLYQKLHITHIGKIQVQQGKRVYNLCFVLHIQYFLVKEQADKHMIMFDLISLNINNS